MTRFGQIIREIRKNRRMTQKVLAKDICSQSVLSRIEQGEEIPNVLVMQRICERLGIGVDRILAYGKEDVKEIQDFFEVLWTYFRKKEWELLRSTIEESKLTRQVVAMTDLQYIYAFSAFCSFYLENDYKQTAELVEKALSHTYYEQKKHLSMIETVLLSLRGQVNYHLKQIKKAENDFYVAMESIYHLPQNSQTAELSIVFYHYGLYLFKIRQYSESEFQIRQGMRWLRKHESTFFMEEFLQLFSLLCKTTNRKEEATVYQLLSEDLTRLRQFSI